MKRNMTGECTHIPTMLFVLACTAQCHWSCSRGSHILVARHAYDCPPSTTLGWSRKVRESLKRTGGNSDIVVRIRVNLLQQYSTHHLAADFVVRCPVCAGLRLNTVLYSTYCYSLSSTQPAIHWSIPVLTFPRTQETKTSTTFNACFPRRLLDPLRPRDPSESQSR